VNILTIGTFDLLHPGHLELLAGCRYQAGTGQVWVGVNRDEFVERYKGHRPTQSLRDRLEVLRALRVVDGVFVNVGDEQAGVLIDALLPDRLAIGDDWLDPGHDERRYFRQLGVTPEWMSARRLSVVYLPRTRGTSSTRLRDDLSPAMVAYYAEQDALRTE
jgi:cytidyltransferase-like protein